MEAGGRFFFDEIAATFLSDIAFFGVIDFVVFVFESHDVDGFFFGCLDFHEIPQEIDEFLIFFFDEEIVEAFLHYEFQLFFIFLQAKIYEAIEDDFIIICEIA